MVETVTVIGVEVEPVTIAELGDTVHVEFAGAPEQVNVTVCWKPAMGATLKPKVALWPLLTVALVGEVTVSKKSGVGAGKVFSIVTTAPE